MLDVVDLPITGYVAIGKIDRSYEKSTYSGTFYDDLGRADPTTAAFITTTLAFK
jgi:hypothetical protein